MNSSITRHSGWAGVLLAGLGCSAAWAELTPQWVRQFAPAQGINAGPAGMLLDPDGHIYMAGRVGNIYLNLDALVWKVNPDGSTAWSTLWDSPQHVHDQGHAFALSPDGSVVIAGATIGQNSYSAGLLVKIDPATGAEIWHRTYDPTEYGGESFDGIAVDATGNIFVVGNTLGDGTDGLIAKYSPAGELLWARTWDGTPEAPYSLDYFRRVLIDPAGDPIVMGYGITGDHDLLEDFVTTKYSSATGAVIWREFFGGPGRDIPNAMVMDTAGGVYITGEDHVMGVTDRRAATVRYANSGGQPLWAEYDQGGARSVGSALTLTRDGRVIVAITADPDFNVSNFNENFYIVSRDQQTGALQWQFRYGANCVGCFDAPQAVVANSAGHVFVAGKTNSAPYQNDIILFQLDATSGAELDRGTIDPGATYTGSVLGLALDARENLYLTGSMNNPNLVFLAARYGSTANPSCYANCDGSSTLPVLNVGDFTCFLQRFAAGEAYANCDGSTSVPVLNVGDFTCFLQRFAQGCE
jgi:outer membrane protein assembly factor BamB